MATFFDGAVMAYRDCADIARKLEDDLPPELAFFKGGFQILADAFGQKANQVLAEINKAKGIK